jgi:hypothetical protein
MRDAIKIIDGEKEWTDHSLGPELFRSKAGIVGSNPTQDMNVYVCVYSVFVLSCV